MKILSIMLIFMSFQAFSSVDCKKHSIYCQIKKNAPHLNNEYSMKLSNIIYKMHKKYNIPKKIFTAILMQESGYSLKAKGCHKGLYLDNEFLDKEIQKCLNPTTEIGLKKPNSCLENINPYKEKKVCTDFGISQIYYKTAEKFNFDIKKLNEDLKYSVEAGAIVLHNFMKKFRKKDPDWFTRYNCGTKSTTKRDTCQIYKRLVERYM